MDRQSPTPADHLSVHVGVAYPDLAQEAAKAVKVLTADLDSSVTDYVDGCFLGGLPLAVAQLRCVDAHVSHADGVTVDVHSERVSVDDLQQRPQILGVFRGGACTGEADDEYDSHEREAVVHLTGRFSESVPSCSAQTRDGFAVSMAKSTSPTSKALDPVRTIVGRTPMVDISQPAVSDPTGITPEWATT